MEFLRKKWAALLKKDQKRDSLPLPNWSIGIYSGTSPLCLKSTEGIINPVLTARHVTDTKAQFVADPFLIQEKDKWYLFFEVMVSDGKACIAFADSSDHKIWNYGKIVLEEPFHLSYPLVLKYKDEYYMIPETRQTRSVRIYRAIDFPTKWKFEKILISGRRFADTTLFFDSEMWWMFTDSGRSTLRLYFAENILGQWIEHPQSPVVKRNLRIARPGGRVIHYNGHLYRFAQDASESYGQKVWGFRILQLSRTEYCEEELRETVLSPGSEKWNNHAMHHLDIHEIKKNLWIAAVDGCGST